MIQVGLLHNDTPDSHTSTRSHILTPNDIVTLFLIIEGSNESIVSIIDEHFLERISSTEWKARDTDTDFLYITENYNSLSRSIDASELNNIRVLFGVLRGDTITLSTFGGTQAIILEEGEDSITDISVHENTGHIFQSITNGKIPQGSTLYLANDNLLTLLGEDVLSEMSFLSSKEWIEIGKNILKRELHSNLHIIRISRKSPSIENQIGRTQKRKQADILSHIKNPFTKSNTEKIKESTKNILRYIPKLENTKQQYIFLFTGIIILFFLVFSLISSILGVFHSTGVDTQKLLLQAKNLVDESQKLTANREAFNKKITEAESIISILQKQETHTVDTKDLTNQIASMKKEVYDIQTIDMSHSNPIIPFNPAEITPYIVYEKNKKLTLVGEEGVILNYVPGDKNIKVIKYPNNERMKSVDMGDNGSLYILTEENHILTNQQENFSYINVIGQNGWENASEIRVFNSNIYLLDQQKNQIYRHKPGINGFTQKNNILQKEISGIFNFSVDGGIYVYMNDGKIQRYLGGNDALKNIILNKIPGTWNLSTNMNSTFITRTGLSYIYVLNGNKLWIFQPSSKRFQDIQSWNYIGQFEIKTEDTIRNISTPKDGTLYVTTNKGIYQLGFESIDGKIIFK